MSFSKQVIPGQIVPLAVFALSIVTLTVFPNLFISQQGFECCRILTNGCRILPILSALGGSESSSARHTHFFIIDREKKNPCMLWQGDEVTFKRLRHAVTRSTERPVGMMSTWHAKMSLACSREFPRPSEDFALLFSFLYLRLPIQSSKEMGGNRSSQWPVFIGKKIFFHLLGSAAVNLWTPSTSLTCQSEHPISIRYIFFSAHQQKAQAGT